MVALQADELEQLHHTLVLLGLGHAEVVERLSDCVANWQTWVE